MQIDVMVIIGHRVDAFEDAMTAVRTVVCAIPLDVSGALMVHAIACIGEHFNNSLAQMGAGLLFDLALVLAGHDGGFL